jgi:hypothetical protein
MSAEESHRIISSSAEAELLVHCARLEVDPARAEQIQTLLSSRKVDWTKLLSLAQRHALIPLLYCQLNRVAAEQVPPERLRELRVRYHNNSALNVLLTGEMVSLLELFDRNQISAVPYKGPAIGIGIYGDLSLRQFADLDILVPEADVWKATELLTERGYQAHFNIPARKQSRFVRLGYVRLFQRDDDPTIVELHWRLAPRFFGAPFDTGRLWQAARTIQIQGVNVRLPLPEDLILMLCIHGAKDCWEKLEWVCGLAELVRSERQIDWQSLLKRATDLGCLKIVTLGILLARDLLEAPIPADVIAQLSQSQTLDSLAGQVVERFFRDQSHSLTLSQRIRFHLQTKDSRREKLRYCLRLALTTTPVDWEMMSLPESASFLYFPLRVLRLIKKYGWQSDQLSVKGGSAGPV